MRGLVNVYALAVIVAVALVGFDYLRYQRGDLVSERAARAEEKTAQFAAAVSAKEILSGESVKVSYLMPMQF